MAASKRAIPDRQRQLHRRTGRSSSTGFDPGAGPLLPKGKPSDRDRPCAQRHGSRVAPGLQGEEVSSRPREHALWRSVCERALPAMRGRGRPMVGRKRSRILASEGGRGGGEGADLVLTPRSSMSAHTDSIQTQGGSPSTRKSKDSACRCRRHLIVHSCSTRRRSCAHVAG